LGFYPTFFLTAAIRARRVPRRFSESRQRRKGRVKSVFRMHLKRVRVPDFRVLKDVDLTFEPDLVPRIFPLGSLNGGGKSTLLQLIFTLLHCSGDNDRIPYLQNMLDGFEVDEEIGKKDLEYLLVDKRVNIELDLASVGFSKVDSDDNSIELYPEDLSHGELKRLSLYMWLKFNKIEDAIVLMDEVEIALHPDWQYQIVNDLQTWAPNNQYILATHSYELCQALTPAHVKEIEPKLIKK
jgi:predicted ATPase